MKVKLALCALAAVLLAATSWAQEAQQPPAQKYFGDLKLVNQDGQEMRLYSDLIKDRTVVIDVMFTRDVWMHRVDIARATDRDLVLDPQTDGPVVADVVAEWAGRHGQPFEITLTGPAGGTFAQGVAGERLELDAVEFCRVLAGRADGDGLLGVRVLF